MTTIHTSPAARPVLRCPLCAQLRSRHAAPDFTGCPPASGRQRESVDVFLPRGDVDWLRALERDTGERRSAILSACIQAARALVELDGPAAIGLGEDEA